MLYTAVLTERRRVCVKTDWKWTGRCLTETRLLWSDWRAKGKSFCWKISRNATSSFLTSTQIDRMKKAVKALILRWARHIEKKPPNVAAAFSLPLLGLARPIIKPAAKALASAGLRFKEKKRRKTRVIWSFFNSTVFHLFFLVSFEANARYFLLYFVLFFCLKHVSF